MRALARDREAAISALKLGPKQHAEIDRNRLVTTSATMPAIDRYTGVLFDALDAASLSDAERAFAHRHVAIHSAMLGPVAALDGIPAYRLSFDSRLPELPLKKHWAQQVAAALDAHRGLVLDLRSHGYAGLGPAPRRDDSLYVHVVMRDEDGAKRALNHFNKQAKGQFVRAIIQSGVEHADTRTFLEWARGCGFEVSIEAGELELTVAQVVGAPGQLMVALR
ncbi:MAG: uncharacterized protein QOF36_1915 [Microbacteriaceae bacterium]|nr:uncharacterized protein [Microbacteriaceae bacterium]